MNPPQRHSNVLVLAPHPDDEALGCGGTICKHSKRGDRVTVVFLTSGELGLKNLSREAAWEKREGEATKACKILGVKATFFLRLPDWFLSDHTKDGAKQLGAILERENPDIIYLPHPEEWHPDHKAVLPLLRAATRRSATATEWRGYEVWTPIAEFDHVENITEEMPDKMRALRSHRSQLESFDYERAVRGLNEFRGALAGKCRYAEVFKVIPVKAR